MADVVILLLIFLYSFWVIRNERRKRKNGRCSSCASCSAGCTGCSAVNIDALIEKAKEARRNG